MVFKISSGIRSEIVSVEGRSLGKVTSLALLQSTYSVLLFLGDSQKARASASLANLGMGFNDLDLICFVGTALPFRQIQTRFRQ